MLAAWKKEGKSETDREREKGKLPALVPKNGIASPLGEIPAHVLNC
jgi:hypothetical protein